MLILLHAALGAASTMNPLKGIFQQQGVAVESLDFPGHGQAAWPSPGFTMEIFEDAVLRLMDEKGIEAAHFMGYSMGGYVALKLALRAPERVLSLSTLATKMDWTEASCARESDLLHPEKIEVKVPQFAAALAEWHPRNGWQKVVNETRSLIEQMHRQRIDDSVLSRIHHAACIMLGDRDTMVTAEETLGLYRALPNAVMAMLPETPHPLDRVDLQLLAGFVLHNMQRVSAQKR